MTNLLLADEINRTSSRTQSALLEVMEEGQVTVDGVTRNIPEPFFVIATQNPLGSAGTQMLPESQMDRFMVLLSMGYPTIKEEMILMSQRKVSDPLDDVNEVISKEELLSMQKEVNEIKVSSLIYQYIAMLSDATRRHDMIQLGVSPRGSLALCRMAKASAFLAGRDYVVPEDVQDVVKDVFRHRLVLKSRARLSSKDADKIMDEICATVHVPDRRAAGGRR
jgi:MoxR-like ATPase